MQGVRVRPAVSGFYRIAGHASRRGRPVRVAGVQSEMELARPGLEALRKVESVAAAIGSRAPAALAGTDRIRTSTAKTTYELRFTCSHTPPRDPRPPPP